MCIMPYVIVPFVSPTVQTSSSSQTLLYSYNSSGTTTSFCVLLFLFFSSLPHTSSYILLISDQALISFSSLSRSESGTSAIRCMVRTFELRVVDLGLVGVD